VADSGNHLLDCQSLSLLVVILSDSLTAALSGMSPKAVGSLLLNVLCTIAEVIETPQTVPSDRIRYTVDAETA